MRKRKIQFSSQILVSIKNKQIKIQTLFVDIVI